MLIGCIPRQVVLCVCLHVIVRVRGGVNVCVCDPTSACTRACGCA